MIIIIRRNSDNKLAIVEVDNPDDYTEFLWTEGNNSCDCNREIYFARALNLPDPFSSITTCSDYKFSICIIDDDGNRIVDEFKREL